MTIPTRRLVPVACIVVLVVCARVEAARAPGAPILAKVSEHRAATWACQTRLGIARTPTAYTARRSLSTAYRRWVADLWHDRARSCAHLARRLADPVAAIRYVFAKVGQADEAVTVADCETGGTFSVYARNGQYLGLFQMSASARARFGHGWTALAQARAALRYWKRSGWSPWQCLPDGGLRW